MSVEKNSDNPNTTHTGAHHFLAGLTDLDIDYIFANLGTDHAPLIETLAQWQKDHRPHPKIILCPHENVAIHMAAGVAAVTGKGQAVLVHVDAGTANAAMGVHNLCRTRLPVLLMSGKTPFTLRNELPGSRDNYVHFVQDPFDIGSLVRPYVKWEYSLPSGITAKEVLRRAHSVMQSDPPGPVYLTLPREVLAETIEDRAVQPFNAQRYGPVALGGIDDSSVDLSGKDLSLNSLNLNNTNEHFTTEIVKISGPTSLLYIQPAGTTNKILAQNFVFEGWSRAGQYACTRNC